MLRTLRRLPAVLLIAAACAVAAPAAAAERYPDRSDWVIGLELGWARFAMDAVNDMVREFNENQDVDDMAEIDSGIDFGLWVGRRLSPALTAGLKFTHLDGSTDLPYVTGAFEINAGANLWSGWLHYVPPVDGGMAYGVGADLGVVATTGEINLAIPDVIEESGDFGGSAPAAAGYLILDFVGTRTVSFQGQVGYRYAKITDVTLAGGPSDAELDHSGFFFRAAFRLHP